MGMTSNASREILNKWNDDGLPTGSNAIGKLAAATAIELGDIGTVKNISAGTISYVSNVAAIHAGTISMVSNVNAVAAGTVDARLLAGENHVGQVGKSFTTVSASVLVDDGTNYAALDFAGTPAVPTLFSGCARVSGGGGVVRDVVVHDRGDQEAPVTLILLTGTPGNTTLTDNSALDFNDADADLIVGMLTVATGDYTDLTSSQVAYKNAADIYFDCASGESDLWGVVQAGGAWNAGGASDLGFTLKIERF